jgi:DNA-binding response OmpR family regulator
MPQIVLLTEDESVVSNFVSRALEREGLTVLIAFNAEQALEVFRNEAIDLVFTDVNLSNGMNGVELAERILAEKPGTKVLVMSGFPEKELLAAEKNLSFLRKPFTAAILIAAIREVLSRIPAQSEK